MNDLNNIVRERIRLDNGNNQFDSREFLPPAGEEKNENERIIAANGRDIVIGGPGNDDIYGGDGADDLFGNTKEDRLFGGRGNDVLEGGADDDLIYGDHDDDILRGQAGNDTLIGGLGNDTLTGLGFVSLELENIFVANDAGDIEDKITEREDILKGDGGRSAGGNQDVFDLLRTSDDEGRLFIKGQQYAVIRDFEPGNDKIRLPGNAGDYVAKLTGTDNQDTAIFYTENPDIDISLGIGAVSIGPSLAVDVENQTALVAIVEDVIVRNMYDTMLYEYKGVG